MVALIITIVSTAIGATWAMRSKMGDIETSLTKLITHESTQRQLLESRVVALETHPSFSKNARRRR